MYVSAIVASGGLGLRMASRVPKPLVKLGRKPIFIHTLNILSRHPEIKEIILVVSSRAMREALRQIKEHRIKKIKTVVLGADKRRGSVENGLACISKRAELVLIHDAVRPFIDSGMISSLITAAKKTGACVLGVPVKPALKKVDAKGWVVSTLNRKQICEIQTPQVFKKSILLRAFKKFPQLDAFDDASLVEKMDKRVAVVLGSYFNIKITTPEDMVFARAILKVLK